MIELTGLKTSYPLFMVRGYILQEATSNSISILIFLPISALFYRFDFQIYKNRQCVIKARHLQFDSLKISLDWI
jgi:hypothetical protein